MIRGPQIFIVEDDRAIRALLRRELTAAGYCVRESEPGQAALRSIAECQIDLLILDIDSEAGGGLEAIRLVRELSRVPILALSTRGDENATADALNSSADDYVRKPFGTKEAVACIKNTLWRRAREQGKAAEIVTGDLDIDLLCRRVRSRGQEVHLSAKPFEVLRVLAEGAGKALTHKEILRAVWGSHQLDRQYLRLAIGALRRKLEPDPAHPRHILTENGVGYRLEIQKYTELRGRVQSHK